MDYPLVSIVCEVFNHEPFLRQCFDGFLMQKTDYPFEVLVHDDASTDGSASIIKEYATNYPELFKPIYQKVNQCSKGIGIWASIQFPRAKGKYIATCEGDDYWVDSNKLQSQVSFLETHPEYGFVGTRAKVLNPNGSITEDIDSVLPHTPIQEGDWRLYNNVFEFAKYGPVTRTVSLCFRKSLIEPYTSYIKGDLVLQTILARFSLFASIDRPMVVYRSGIGISSNHNCLEKQLDYNDWYISNRRTQMILFPGEIVWDEDLLNDRTDYLRLKIMIRDRKWKQALLLRDKLRTNEYKNKSFSKFLLGPISCLFLSIVLNCRN